MNEESDAVLIVRAQEEPEAFGALYERYVGKIYNYIYYRTSNHHDAEDLTARTFQRAMKHMARYVDRGAPFSAWLYRIAHNVVANWHRDRSRRQFVALDDVPLTGPRREDPVVLSEEWSQKATLMQAVQQLPPERQQLIILKFVEQMSNAEIGNVMGRTEGAIKSLYHRTLVALREELVRVQDQPMETVEGRQ